MCCSRTAILFWVGLQVLGVKINELLQAWQIFNQFGLFLHVVALSRFEIQQPRNTGTLTVEVIRSSMMERWWDFLCCWFVEYKAWKPHHYTSYGSIKNMIRDDLNSYLEHRQYWEDCSKVGRSGDCSKLGRSGLLCTSHPSLASAKVIVYYWHRSHRSSSNHASWKWDDENLEGCSDLNSEGAGGVSFSGDVSIANCKVVWELNVCNVWLDVNNLVIQTSL